MVVDYSQGKIYRLVNNDNDLIYIGSTCQTLANRLSQHRRDYKKYQANLSQNYCSSYEILKHPSAKILLVRHMACENKDQLCAIREAYVKVNDCVNKGNLKKMAASAYKKRYRKINGINLMEKHDCPCGGRYATEGVSTHKKSKMHSEFMKTHHKCECGAFYKPADEQDHCQSSEHIAYEDRVLSELFA